MFDVVTLPAWAFWPAAVLLFLSLWALWRVGRDADPLEVSRNVIGPFEVMLPGVGAGACHLKVDSVSQYKMCFVSVYPVDIHVLRETTYNPNEPVMIYYEGAFLTRVFITAGHPAGPLKKGDKVRLDIRLDALLQSDWAI